MNNKDNLCLAYIGGGSRGWAWKLMADLALEEELSGTVKLYDLDVQAACDNQAIGARLSQRKEAVGKWRYETVETLEKALAGADFVIISILPGTFEEMASDVHLPEKYGIYQPVGDTTGPGGLVRALRTIPVYVDFAEKIKKICPNAWVINYTNPMALCVRTLYQAFPQIKAFGCCHEVFGTQELLCSMLGEMNGLKVSREEIKLNVLGINHFTWLDRATCRHLDLFPLYEEFADKHREGYEKEKDSWKRSVFSCAHKVKFDLFKRYGLIAAAGDRHLVEFLPPWYVKDPETVAFWKFNLTSVDWRVQDQREKEARRKRLVNGEEELPLAPSGEEGVRQIKALLGLGDLVTNVNLPNYGQIPGLPPGSVVETNALFTRDCLRPVMAGKLPVDLENLVIRHVLNQETVLRAALERNRELAFHAFINDPLVTIDRNKAEELFAQMLHNTREYLPGWQKSV